MAIQAHLDALELSYDLLPWGSPMPEHCLKCESAVAPGRTPDGELNMTPIAAVILYDEDDGLVVACPMCQHIMAWKAPLPRMFAAKRRPTS